MFHNVVSAQPSLETGQTLYDVCAGCHGFLAEGNPLVAAPQLAGLDANYLARQMRNFLGGIRGYETEDVNGHRMATMAEAVRSDRDLEDLVAYIGTLPGTERAPSIDGDTVRGQQAYAACAACHGADARGNSALSSPGLAGLDDWYVVEQLRLFAEGLRGMHPSDTYGQQMRTLAPSFADERTREDLARYIRTLAE